MAAALKRFWTWANQPVKLGREHKQPVESIPVLEVPHPAASNTGLPDSVTVLNLNLEDASSANDALNANLSPDEYLGHNADELVEGLESYLQAHAITSASEISWAHLLDEVKVIKLKRVRLMDLENECEKIRYELQECKKNLAMQAKRASAEESSTIVTHEKRLELARAVTRRIDAL